MNPDKLKKWRQNHFYTQAELAKILDVTKTCVYRWEAGLRNIPPFLQLALDCLESKKGEAERRDKKRERKRRRYE